MAVWPFMIRRADALVDARGLTWAVGITKNQKVDDPDVRLVPPAGRARQAVPDHEPQEAEAVLAAHPWRCLTWRRGTKGRLTARFAATRVRVGDGLLAADGPACTISASRSGEKAQKPEPLDHRHRQPCRPSVAGWSSCSIVHGTAARTAAVTSRPRYLLKYPGSASVTGRWASSRPSDHPVAGLVLPSVVGIRAATSCGQKGAGGPV
jgi:hypothetical protein